MLLAVGLLLLEVCIVKLEKPAPDVLVQGWISLESISAEGILRERFPKPIPITTKVESSYDIAYMQTRYFVHSTDDMRTVGLRLTVDEGWPEDLVVKVLVMMAEYTSNSLAQKSPH